MSFDPFHVIALASRALDEVRRAEVKIKPDLRGSRWALLKDAGRWSDEQLNTMHWLRRSHLRNKRPGATLRAHRDGIIEHFRSGLSNGFGEGINAQIQVAKARAKGYATNDNLIAISCLLCARLKHLPRNPWLQPAAG